MKPDNNDLIPLGSPSATFDLVMRGYDRNQVATHIGQLQDDLRTLVTERDSIAARANELKAENDRASEELEVLRSQVNASSPSYETMGGRIASMLRLAEEEAAEIRRAADEDAAAVRQQAADEAAANAEDVASLRAEADQYLADRTAEADSHLAAVQAEAADYLDSHRKQAEEILGTAQSESATLLAESAAKRDEAEQDFEITLNARRSAAAKDEAERDRVSREDAANRIQKSRATADELVSTAHREATRVLNEANEKSTAMITAAEEEVNRLQNLRAAMAQQFLEIGRSVASMPTQLAIEPERLLAERQIDAPSAALPAEPELYGDQPVDVPADSTDAPAEDEVVAELAEDVASDESESEVDATATDEAITPEDADDSDTDSPVAAEPDGESDPGTIDEFDNEGGVEPDVAREIDTELVRENAAYDDATDVAESPEAEQAADEDSQQSLDVALDSAAARSARKDDDISPSESTVQLSAIRSKRPRPGRR